MKKYLYILMGIAILFSSCKSKDSSVEKQELTREEKIAQRTMELEKIVEESLRETEERAGEAKEQPGKYSWGSAPDFSLKKVGGGNMKLSDYAGKVIVVDFWATWCGPCRKGIPEFIELYDDYKSKGFMMVGVNLDRGGADRVKAFVKEIGINYPVVFGNQDVANDFGGIRGIPAAFIIDRNGNVINKIVGYRPRSVFETEIKKLL